MTYSLSVLNADRAQTGSAHHKHPPFAEEPLSEQPPYDELIDRVMDGEIIPFLGAGASAFAANQEGGAPPSAGDLGTLLASRAGITITRNGCNHPTMDLAQIASYYQNCVAPRHRLDSLLTKEISNPRFRPNKLHILLAQIALRKPLLIITTNYDNLLEQAFAASSVPFELIATPVTDLVYAGKTTESNDASCEVGSAIAGGWLHWVTDQESPQTDFKRADEQHLLFDLRNRSVIYKVHGTVPLDTGDGDYLIAEEDYTRFLGRMETGDIVPRVVRSSITKKRKTRDYTVFVNSLLFLGYSIQDWNLRVLLDELGIGHRHANEERHYAIMRYPQKEEKELLAQRHVKVFDCDLGLFATEMSKRL